MLCAGRARLVAMLADSAARQPGCLHMPAALARRSLLPAQMLASPQHSTGAPLPVACHCSGATASFARSRLTGSSGLQLHRLKSLQSPATRTKYASKLAARSAATAAPGTPEAPPAPASPSQPAAQAAAAGPSSTGDSAWQPARELWLHNTLGRAKQRFSARPGAGRAASMYVCGVTVYDYSHIGHARVYVAFDVLLRTLRALGYDVTYVRNFTDIDDKIIARAAVAGEDPLALSRRFIEEFHADMDALGCLRPTAEPKATDHVADMVAAIQRIIDNGHAYVAPGGGDVFFDVASLPGYGVLSGRAQEDNRAGERVAVDARKRGPSDFALWKAAKPGEPTWPSPWGAGRPGWHIECSAMIGALLGPEVDIHGGGQDLVFPHHENEIAQARAAACPCGASHDHAHGSNGAAAERDGGSAASTSGLSGGSLARFWVHNGFVNVDAEKMSKSLGNFFTIRDVLRSYHATALRWFLTATHYRAPVNYTQRALEEASDRVYYLYQALADAQAALAGAGDAGVAAVQQAEADVPAGRGAGGELLASAQAALCDDLNTPAVAAALSAPLKTLNDLLHTKAGKKAKDRTATLAALTAGLAAVLELVGLPPASRAAAVLAELRAVALARAGLSEEQVAAAIQRRAEARKAKDFGAADAVRRELEAVGIAMMDSPQGTTWKPAARLEAAQD